MPPGPNSPPPPSPPGPPPASPPSGPPPPLISDGSGSIEKEDVIQSLLIEAQIALDLGTRDTPEVAELGTLTVDDTPPMIELLGNGTLEFPSTSNWTVMVHHITTLDTWQDPGVVAVDDTFGDLTQNVEVTGPKEIDFTIPTDPGDPHIFEYRVKDAMGNEGIAKRELHISCPESAALCKETLLEGMGQGNVAKMSCGLLGACGMSMAFGLGGAEEGDPDSMLTRVMPKPDANTILEDQPIIHLLGPSVAILAQGADYFACTANSPPKEVCDPGALASSAAEGDLTPQVLACAPPEPKLQMLLGEDHLFDSHGIAPCGVDTTIPGNRSLTFSIQSRKNPSLVASVTRTLVIAPACDVEERLCADLSTCSKNLVCPYDILGSVSFDDVLADQDTSLEPLQLALVGPAMVEVRYGSSYVACKPGEVESKCDPGAVIVGGSSADTHLEVLALAGSFPASSCLSRSCLGAQFSSRGLSGTGLNTSAPVGTQFTIQFAAVDSAALTIVTANRTIFISHPCENKQHFLCGDGTCSPVECHIRDLVLGVGAEYQQPPSVSLRGGASLVVRYGTGSHPDIVSLLPCQSISSLECGAVASDSLGNDISSSIRVREVTTCSDAASGDDCPACAPNQQGSGMCLPGQYKYRYEVTDSNGNYASQDRLLLITETGDLELTLRLASRSSDGDGFVPSFEQVEKLVDALTRQESPSIGAFIGAVNAIVDQAGPQLGPFGLDSMRVQGAKARVEAGGRPALEVKVVASVLAQDASFETNSTVATSGLRRLLASTSQDSVSLLEALGTVQTILGNSISNGQLGAALQERDTEIGSMELQSGRSSASALQTSPPVRKDLGMLVSSLSSVHQSVAALTLQTGGLSEALETALAMPPHLDSPEKLSGIYMDLITEYNSVVALVEDSALQAKRSMARQAELAESISEAYGEQATEMEEAIAYMDRRIRFLLTSLEFLGGLGAEQTYSCPAFESNHRGTFRVSFTAQAYRGEAAIPSSERWAIPCVLVMIGPLSPYPALSCLSKIGAKGTVLNQWLALPTDLHAVACKLREAPPVALQQTGSGRKQCNTPGADTTWPSTPKIAQWAQTYCRRLGQQGYGGLAVRRKAMHCSVVCPLPRKGHQAAVRLLAATMAAIAITRGLWLPLRALRNGGPMRRPMMAARMEIASSFGGGILHSGPGAASMSHPWLGGSLLSTTPRQS